MTHLRTPPLKSDADPDRSAVYAARLAAATTIKETTRVHAEFADLREHQTLRQEISGMIHAPKGSPEAKARTTLGITLILFGLFGVPILFWILLAIGSAIF